MLGKNREVMRLAEERREIGGQRVGKRLLLLCIARFHQIEISAETIQPALPQPPRETAVGHVALGRG